MAVCKFPFSRLSDVIGGLVAKIHIETNPKMDKFNDYHYHYYYGGKHLLTCKILCSISAVS